MAEREEATTSQSISGRGGPGAIAAPTAAVPQRAPAAPPVPLPAAPRREPGRGAANEHTVDCLHVDPIAPARRDAVRPEPPLPQITLLGVTLHAVRQHEVVEHVLARSAAGRGGWIATPNLDHLRRLVRDPGFARLCAGASLRVADGAPLLWASRLQGTPLPERVAGSDLVSSLAEGAARARRSLFLLGGNHGAAERAAQVLAERFEGLAIAGTACPRVGFERDPEQLAELTRALVAARPDIVYVALGSPKQEQLIERLAPELPGAWWIGVGISLSFLAGEVRRAPRWLRASGLEWLHRLAQEPRRLAHRYLVQGLPFSLALFAGAARARLFPPRPSRR